MLNWSDLHPADARPAATGPAAAALLAAAVHPGDTVLVAGPHAHHLYADLAPAAAVDILVRSAPDAEELAETLGAEKTQVYCGSLDRFTSTETYDLIVALDGLERLVGPDTPTLPWSEALAELRTRLAPGGRLLLGATNPFSINNLIQPDITAALPRDEDWGRSVVDAPPAGLKPLMNMLSAADITPTATYGVFPSLTDAEVVVDGDNQLGAAAAGRVLAATNAGPVLRDPYRVVMDAAAGGLLVALAPAWYVVVGAVAAFESGEGELLEERLVRALRVDDQAALRREVVGYVEWLRTTETPGSPENVIVVDGAYRLHGEGLVGVEAALERFVERVLQAGVRVPWPAGGDGRELTARLASMAGVTLTPSENLEVTRPLGSAEQLATVARLADELAHASARAILFEGTVSGIRRSVAYRVGHAVLNPARVIRRRIKRVLRRR
ncbi:hypothetical protein GCM10009534_01320 [Kribbella sandramycini]|nr:hypothetical protein [Kribbella sandramycini]